MAKNPILFLSSDDVRSSLSLENAIKAVRNAFIELSLSRATVPTKQNIDISERSGTVLFMPAFLSDIRQLGIKIVSVFNRNPEKGLPAIQALLSF